MWPLSITVLLAIATIAAEAAPTPTTQVDWGLPPDNTKTQAINPPPTPQNGSTELFQKAHDKNDQQANEAGAQKSLDLLLSSDADIRVRLQAQPFTQQEKEGELQKARELEESVRRLGSPNQTQVATNALGVIYMRLGMFWDALDVLQEIDFEHVEPGSRALYRYNLGRAFERNQKPNEAIAFYLEGIREQPEFVPAMEGAFRVVSNASSGVDPSKADELLVLLVRHYAEIGLDPKQFETTEAPRLQPLAGATPFWKEGLVELQKAYAGEFSGAEPGTAQNIFPAWSQSRERSQTFSLLLVQLGDMMQRAHGKAAERDDIPGRQALTSYLIAWGLDRSNGTAALRTAVALDNHPALQEEYKHILLQQPVDSGVEFQRKDLQAFSLFRLTMGEILSRSQPCGFKEDPATPFYQYEQALLLEKRARGSGSDVAPGAGHGEVDAAPRHQPMSCGPELSQAVSSSPALNRHLADCSRRSGDKAAFRKFDKGVECSLRNYRQESLVEEKWEYHFNSTVYAGSWLRSGIQAGLTQAIDTPQKWGQGARGYGRRFASTFATRTLRQMLAFGVDATLGEDPHFVPSPHPGFKSRFWYSFKQTFISQNDRLSPTLATWRLTSAFGSEFISNAWRPTGHGLGDNNIRSGFARGLFVLGGDTAGNVLREFLPRRGRLGKLLRPFVTTEKGDLRSLINPFAGKD